MYKIGDKIKYIGSWGNFTVNKTYEIAIQRLSNRNFVIFDDNNDAQDFTNDMINFHFEIVDNSINKGGSTDYYKFKENWKECADIIEDREMNYNQGNIFKSAFCFNIAKVIATCFGVISISKYSLCSLAISLKLFPYIAFLLLIVSLQIIL